MNETILEEASRVVDGERNDSYGRPSQNHQRTADLWSAFLGRRITPDQVCICNMLQKISRHANSWKRDNLVDIAGYARNAEMVAADCYEPDAAD